MPGSRRARIVLLGNDVQDLRDPDSDEAFRDERARERVFTREERECMENSADPRRALWSVWALKEAAYKALTARYEGIIFSWREFRVNESLNRVQSGPHELYGEVRVSSADSLHALCLGLAEKGGAVPFSPDENRLLARVDCADSPREATRESLLVRELTLRTAREYLGADATRLSLADRTLRLDGRALGWPLSISHHGRCLACAFYDSSGESRTQ